MIDNTCSILKGVISILFTYIIMVAMGLALLYVTHRIPFATIAPNVEKSLHIIHKEGELYNLLSNNFNVHISNSRYVLDGLTDGIMLKETYNAGQEDVLETVLLNRFVRDDKMLSCDSLLNYTRMSADSYAVYGRYWHGYLTTLLPSLMLMDLSKIRMMNLFLFSLLLISICYLSYKKIGKSISVFFLITVLISMFFPIVPYSLQFSTVFYISFISIVILLTFDRIWQNRMNAILMFFIVGGVTSYADLLTAPVITIGMPLIFYSLMKKTGLYKDVLLFSFMWLLGYGLMWGTKWVLAYYLTGYDMVQNAVDQSFVRFGNDISVVQILGTIAWGTPTIIQWFILIVLGFWIGATKNKERMKNNMWLLIIALLPVLWMCVLKNHSSIHFWFVWRGEMVSIFALLIFVYRTTERKWISVYLRSICKKRTNDDA